MSKVGIYTDAHFSLTSSILSNMSGYKYSARLDLLVQSFKWMYEEFDAKGVELIINAGDLIDSDIIKAEENSALSEALSHSKGIPELHIVGNHEKKDKSNKYHSLSLLDKNRSISVVDTPMKYNDEISLLPFTTDEIDFESLKNKVLISHMNYEGMTVGVKKLEWGLSQEYVLSYFDKVLNGHIHAASKEKKGQVLNIGSLFGIGFGDSYDVSYPGIMILDTETLKIERIRNPYSVIFLKLKAESVGDLKAKLKKANKVDNPKCIKVEVPYLIRDDIREFLTKVSEDMNIVSSRVQGKVESSSVYLVDKESDENISGFESGSDAMKQYVDSLDEAQLPAPKDKMVKFIEEFLM